MTAKNDLEIQGNLSRNPIAELLTEIAQIKLSGSLRITQEKHKIIIYFDKGDVVFAVSNSRKHRLFEILLGQKQITREQLSKIENFTNDLYLTKTLVKENVINKAFTNALFAYQIKLIVASSLTFTYGEWTFSSLARIKDGIRFDVEIDSVLFNFAKTIDLPDVFARFKSFDEVFRSNPAKNMNEANFTPNEAFIMSRMNQDGLTIDNLRSMSGLENNELLQILYRLWLGGFVFRSKWNSAFSKHEISNINSANFTLRTSAISVEKEMIEADLKKINKEQKIADQIAKEKAKKVKEKADKVQEIKLSLEEYINRIEDAATHYEIFDVLPNAEITEVKKVYFKLAKQFHPDLYHKKVDPELHAKIQNSFTEIAHAYETLKDEEAREVYDFKLRKVIEKLNINQNNSGQIISKNEFENSNQATMASDNFDRGYDLLMNEEYEDALPQLGRAVHLEESNARYHAFYGKALSFDKNKRHNAETHLQTAIKLDSDNSVYRIMLAELFIEIGLKARARGELNRLIKIAPDNREAKSLLDSLTDK